MNFYTTSALTLILFYILLIIVMFFFQRNLLYHPSVDNYIKDNFKDIAHTLPPYLYLRIKSANEGKCKDINDNMMIHDTYLLDKDRYRHEGVYFFRKADPDH